MGLLNDAISHMDSVLFSEEFSESIIYTPKGGDPVPGVSAHVIYGVDENSDGIGGDGAAWRLTAERDTRVGFGSGDTRSVITVIIQVSDVTTPGYQDKITISGVDYFVTEIFDA